MLRNARVNAFTDSLVQMVHVAPAERWFERQHLVNYAAEGPHVRLEAVWLVLPHFRRGVVRRASLRVVEPIRLSYFAYIHIAQLRLVQVASLGLLLLRVAEKKNVC